MNHAANSSGNEVAGFVKAGSLQVESYQAAENRLGSRRQVKWARRRLGEVLRRLEEERRLEEVLRQLEEVLRRLEERRLEMVLQRLEERRRRSEGGPPPGYQHGQECHQPESQDEEGAMEQLLPEDVPASPAVASPTGFDYPPVPVSFIRGGRSKRSFELAAPAALRVHRYGPGRIGMGVTAPPSRPSLSSRIGAVNTSFHADVSRRRNRTSGPKPSLTRRWIVGTEQPSSCRT
jgi:hypothetical protein